MRMFSANLSSSILRLCGMYKLSYEAASERCELSARYFAQIAQGKTSPSILTLEKLCIGFDRTPNDLLIPSSSHPQELSYRIPMPVTEVRCFDSASGRLCFPVCPHCGQTMEREYQSYCDRCGQCLDWERFP